MLTAYLKLFQQRLELVEKLLDEFQKKTEECEGRLQKQTSKGGFFESLRKRKFRKDFESAKLEQKGAEEVVRQLNEEILQISQANKWTAPEIELRIKKLRYENDEAQNVLEGDKSLGMGLGDPVATALLLHGVKNRDLLKEAIWKLEGFQGKERG